MTDPHELEAALQREWNDDTAAVYADLLTSRGDPHGELIALDLALAKGITSELLARKRELLAAWLRSDTVAEQPWRLHSFTYGLARGFSAATTGKHEISDYLTMLIDAVGGRLREVSLHGDQEELQQGVATLARSSLPWLGELALHRTSGARPIDHQVWEALIAATPNLRTLRVAGDSVVLSPIHPAVRTLHLEGAAIAIGRLPVPGVTTLRLSFAGDRYQLPPDAAVAALAAMVNPRAFPAVVQLDLSWNEPPKWDAPDRPRVFSFLDAVEDLDRFEHLRMPSVADYESAQELIAILERCPRLTIEVARMYTLLDVEHPRLHLPPPRAWPATAHGRDALAIGLPGGGHRDELALSSLIDDLEAKFDAMRPEAQQAWLAFWDFLDELRWEDEQGNTIYKELSAITLLTALEALDGTNNRADNVAVALRDANLPSSATVTISRYWGW